MNNTHMKIWDQVATTETKYTKKAKVSGQEITSLNGTAMIMKATSVFGPVGIGFGWKVLEERFDKGIEIFSGEGDNRFSLGHTSNHTVRILLWYVLDGQRGEIESYGCTNYIYKSSYGMSCDGEAPKKSTTDAIKKALSALGFSADVFLGLFDDTAYVDALKAEEAIENAEDKEAEIARQEAERLAYIKGLIDSMNGALSLREATKIHDSAIRILTARKDQAGMRRVIKELKTLTETKFKVEQPQ